MTRREFLIGGSALAAGGCTGVRGLAGRPDLRLGVLSDIHIAIDSGRMPGPEERHTLRTRPYFEKALRYFRERRVDAVVIAGDMADFGMVEELKLVAESWYRVFPGDRGADGQKVEKVFIYGNHDAIAWRWGSTWYGRDWTGADRERKWRASIAFDPAAAWETCFHEKYEPIYLKRVKGHAFVGAHWIPVPDPNADWRGGADVPGLAEFFARRGDELRGSKPFFYVQHAHPKDTCLSPYACHDSGASTAILSKFPNAVAFSGHAHQPLTDDRDVWQGAFLSIGTASLLDAGGRDWRENGAPYAKGVSKLAHMPWLRTSECRHGLVVSLFGDEIEIERRDFNWGESLGESWRTRIGSTDLDWKARAAASAAPQFADGAGVRSVLNRQENRVEVTFDAATKGGRTYDYEVRAIACCDDYERIAASRRILAPDYHLPPSQVGRPGEVWFALGELPSGGRFRFDVRPVNCHGKAGRPIAGGERTI